MRFREAISGKKGMAIIAEVKNASPSHGSFGTIDMARQIEVYVRGGAAAISLVTAAKNFQGNMQMIREVRLHTSLPILRKDFITKVQDIDETKLYGADAVLLIAKDLSETQLTKLSTHALNIGLVPVIEIYSEDDCKKLASISYDAVMLINNRNLKNLEINTQHALAILPLIDPKHVIIVASGFSQPAQLIPYKGSADAALIGTSLLTAADPAQLLHSFTQI